MKIYQVNAKFEDNNPPEIMGFYAEKSQAEVRRREVLKQYEYAALYCEILEVNCSDREGNYLTKRSKDNVYR